MKFPAQVPRLTRCLAASLLLVGGAPAGVLLAPLLQEEVATAPVKDPLPGAAEWSNAVEALLQAGAVRALPRASVDELYNLALARTGKLEPFLDLLRASEDESLETDPDRTRGLWRIHAELAWRYGFVKEARSIYQKLAKDHADLDARLQWARLQDLEGNTKEAVEAYRVLLPLVDASTAERLHLRIALMDLQRPKAETSEAAGVAGPTPPDPLSEFALEPLRSTDVRNRAAIVLALLGKPGPAIDLYQLDGDAKEQGLGQLRLAEWGIAAKQPEVAQQAAWEATQVATVARERRYALALLAEAHRIDGSLDRLVERFHENQSSLSPEARALWVELLRETQQYEQAIELAHNQAARGTFPEEEQLELFEMYREAGRDADLIAAYHERIANDPGNVVWREGLSRYYLEAGNRDEAVNVWRNWIDAYSEGQHLVGGDALVALGLDELAVEVAQLAIANADGGGATSQKTNAESAQLFLVDLYRERGRLDDARTVLQGLDERSAPDAPVRIQLADAFERLGDQRRAVEVLRGLVASRPEGEAGEDVEMRLAWLQSEVGEEEVALAQWRSLWLRVQSVPRRRYVEDRMMTVASRLGVLADVAVELEDKLFQGIADERESGLLVRLYTKVGDAVSAAEVIEEFMRRSGGSEVQTLTEKARVYLACTDYYHYEEAVQRLITLDPEGEPDYLRQLAMSQLERGKPKEARAVLMRLASLESEDSASLEFEAGVLALSGMREEAVQAYRKGLAIHPDRIDAYILMAGLQKDLGKIDQAVGMFQYLAETADKDDLFTIAIDGLLNMLVDAPPRPKMVEWARRITLERLAGEHDRPYLYQLLSDLASEAKDHDGNVLALENALPSAGPRRGALLRELMDLTIEKRSSFDGPGWAGNKEKHLAMGRRLVGLAEAVPPDVYLNLGAAFLKAKDERAAERTFALTRALPDGAMYQRQAAASFEKEGFVQRALGMYESVLATQPSDVPLIAKVAELHENLGEDVRAFDLYCRSLDLLLRRRPFAVDATEKTEEGVPEWERNLNVDDFTQNYERVWLGLMATMPDETALGRFLEGYAAAVQNEWPQVRERAEVMRQQALAQAVGKEKPSVVPLERFPRLARRTEVYRRTALAFGRSDWADQLDQMLLDAFPDDDVLLEGLLRQRLSFGLLGSAKRLIEASGRDAAARRALLVRVGEVVESTGSSPIALGEAARQVLPLIAEGRIEELEAVVRRADLGQVDEENMGQVSVLFSAARYLGNQDLILKVGRDFLRLKMAGSQSYELENTFEVVSGALDPENQLALGRYFVARVFEDPAKNASLVTLLPSIAKRFEQPLISTEQVLQMLEGYGEEYAWGLEPVIGLLPDGDRAAAVRTVWSKLEKTQRAPLLINLVTETQGEIGDEFAKFLRDNLASALPDAEEYLEYTISELGDVKGKDALVLDLLDVLQANGWDRLKYLPALRAVRLEALGQHAEAVALAGKTWIELGVDEDWRSREALATMGTKFLPASLVELMALHASARENLGDSVELRRSELMLLKGSGPEHAIEYEQRLEQALVAYPDNEALLQEAADFYEEQGRAALAARTLERVIAVQTEDAAKKRNWRHVERLWKGLKQYEKVLEAQRATLKLDGSEEEDEGVMLVSGGMVIALGAGGSGSAEEEEPGLPKSIDDVKAAIARGEAPQAARILRRIWRRFPVGEAKDPFRFYRYYSPMGDLTWPKDEDRSAERKALGGMLAFQDQLAEERAKKAANADAEEPGAFERMAPYPPLVEELERFLRTQDPGMLDRLQPLFKGLLAARQARLGIDESLAELVERAQTGRASKIDKILLLASLDRLSGALPEGVQAVLADLPRTVAPRDAAQIRRLARVYAKSGDKPAARALFRWCGTQATGRGYYYGADDGSTTVSVDELVTEAKDLFAGEERIGMIEDVLQFADSGDQPWERTYFGALVLRTWEEVLEPKDALARAHSICEEAIDLKQGLQRELALGACGMFARGGEFSRALKALEYALAKLDPALVTQPKERWSRSEPERFGELDDAALERLFPSGEGTFAAATAEWLQMAGKALVAWSNDQRIDDSVAVRSISWIAWQLFRQGSEEEARALLASLGERAMLPARDRLWWIDSLRLQGQTGQALAMERTLMQSGRLPVDRLPGVLEALVASEGPAQALLVMEPIALDTHQPELLALLVQTAEQVSDEAAVERWKAAQTSAEAAKTKIEELERKVKEKKAKAR